MRWINDMKNGAKKAPVFLLLVVCFTVHNIEELALDLPAWMAATYETSTPISSNAFLGAVVVVTVLAWIVYFGLKLRPLNHAFIWIAALVSAALAANSLGHVILSVFYWSLMPGLITAILIMGPVGLVSFYETCGRLELTQRGTLALFVGGVMLQFLVLVLATQLGNALVA